MVENEDILYENLVAVTLFERSFYTGEEIYYWKHESEKEIDFIVKKGPKIIKLIQVSFNIESQTTLDRECRALVIGSRELQCDDLILLTENKSLELIYEWQNEKKKIKIIPLYLWLTGLN